MHKGSRHHLLVPNQYIGGGLWVKVYRGCDLATERKRLVKERRKAKEEKRKERMKRK